MNTFIATIFSAPHDRRGFKPTILKRMEVEAMNWRSARTKIKRVLANMMAETSDEIALAKSEPHRLLRPSGIEVMITEKRLTEPRPDCWSF